mgnify:CR=1 FL=1
MREFLLLNQVWWLLVTEHLGSQGPEHSDIELQVVDLGLVVAAGGWVMGAELEAGTVGVVILSGGGKVAGDHRVQGIQGRWNGERGQVKGAGDVEPESV